MATTTTSSSPSMADDRGGLSAGHPAVASRSSRSATDPDDGTESSYSFASFPSATTSFPSYSTGRDGGGEASLQAFPGAYRIGGNGRPDDYYYDDETSHSGSTVLSLPMITEAVLVEMAQMAEVVQPEDLEAVIDARVAEEVARVLQRQEHQKQQEIQSRVAEELNRVLQEKQQHQQQAFQQQVAEEVARVLRSQQQQQQLQSQSAETLTRAAASGSRDAEIPDAMNPLGIFTPVPVRKPPPRHAPPTSTPECFGSYSQGAGAPHGVFEDETRSSFAPPGSSSNFPTSSTLNQDGLHDVNLDCNGNIHGDNIVGDVRPTEMLEELSDVRTLEWDQDESSEGPRGLLFCSRRSVSVAGLVLLVGVGAGVGFAFAVLRSNSTPPSGVRTDPPEGRVTAFPTLPPGGDSQPIPPGVSGDSTTFGTIMGRGSLRCGVNSDARGFSVVNETTGLAEGFDADLCRAVGAAIFGEDGHVDFVAVSGFDRFASLAFGQIDLLVRTTTHTMERSIFEPTTGQGFSFSVPYLYNGLQFAGISPFVECADDFTVEGECAETRICALDSSTHISRITSENPDMSVVSVVGKAGLYTSFVKGFCNVVAGEQFDIAESVWREQGYTGNFAMGSKVHSKEPLSLVTRNDDPQWSDFVNWVLQALLMAEEMSISSHNLDNALMMDAVDDLLGRFFEKVSCDAIRLVGNYGEIYNRHLTPILTRPIQDRINVGTSGLIFSFPFGAIDPEVGDFGPGPVRGGTLELIGIRKKLRCGVLRRPVFAAFDIVTKTWSGFDIDFCAAIAAAMFDGNATRVEYIEVFTKPEGFQVLNSGDIDIFPGVRISLQSDVLESSTETGFTFSQPIFYDGLTFAGDPTYAECADQLEINADQCRDMLVCVTSGSDHERRVFELFPERFIVSRESALQGFLANECNVIAGSIDDISVYQVRQYGYDGVYQLGVNRYTKDPRALAIRHDDPQWSQFVFWVVSAIFYAEEEGIGQEIAEEMPTVRLFGPQFFNIFRDAIGAVGSYAEIYERNAEAIVPRGGPNDVNQLLGGPQHYPYPGFF